MPLSFSNLRDEILSGGIDSRNAENQIDAGFLRDALNADVVQKYVKKRRGYVGYAGNVPVRVISVDSEVADTQICFTLDQSISLLSARSSPIVAYGRLRSGSMDAIAAPTTNKTFNSTTDVARYYPGFTQNIRNTFLIGDHTGPPNLPKLEIPAATSGLTTPFIFLGVQKSLEAATLKNEYIEYDSLSVNSTTNDISVGYVNGTGIDIPVFVYYSAKPTVTGSSYVSLTPTPTVVGPNSTFTRNIPAAEHQLANLNIIVRTYQIIGGEYRLAFVDTTIVNQITGDVSITITNGTIFSETYFHILSAAPATNTKGGKLSGSTYTITIDNPDSPFIFPGIYIDNVGILEEVGVDSIEYDPALDRITITFQNPGGNSYKAFWEYGEIRSNQICVTDTDVDTNLTDTLPQLTIWGLDHIGMYGSDPEQRAGWTNHIDSYRSQGENRLVAGLGGNLFAAKEYSEAGTDYLYGSLLSSLFGRTSQSRILAPAFWLTGETPGRTRGYVTGTGLSDNWSTIHNVSYDSSVAGGSVRYDIEVPGLLLHDSTGTVIATNDTNIRTIISQTAGLEDYLSVDQMSYIRHEGTFRIVQISVTGTMISIWCENPAVDTSDYDDDGVAGNAGVFTDLLTFSAASEFIPADQLLSDAISSEFIISCLSSSSSSIVVDGIANTISIAPGVQITGKRTSSVVPLRNALDVDSVVNFVAGDIVSYSRVTRLLRILHINVGVDTSISITSDGTTATAILGTGNTDRFAVGQSILIRAAGVYTGERVITGIPEDDTIEFSSLETVSTSGTLVGNTISLGESLEWQDSTSDSDVWTVERRWIPVEAPDDTYDMTPATRIRHFDSNEYDFQPFIRSSMVNDNLYLTNYDDAVQKYDGVNLYRAGLPAWQPGAFISKDTTATAKIVTNLRAVTYTALSAALGRITVSTDQLGTLPLGTVVLLTNDPDTYVISSIDTTLGYVFLDRSLSSLVVVGTMREIAIYKYYYRLNAIDANNNIIASAIAQSDDYTMRLDEDAAIRHKLIGLPSFDNYDYDTIYLEVYRTLRTGLAPYYRVFQQRVSFNNWNGYIEFTDTLRDTNLIDLDPTSSLKSGELGIGWSDPLRAKCITSAANTAIYGNLRDLPQLDIQLFDYVSTIPDSLQGTFLFRKDATDISSDVSNVLTRQKYVFTNLSVGATGTDFRVLVTDYNATSIDIIASGSITGLSAGDWVYMYYKSIWTSLNGDATAVVPATDRFTLTAHGMNSGDAVKWTQLTGAAPTVTGPVLNGSTLYVERIDANTYKLHTTQELVSAKDVTVAGTGTYRLDAIRDLSTSGWHQVYAASGSTFSFHRSSTVVPTGPATHILVALSREDIPISCNNDGNFGQVSGNTNLTLFRAANRLAEAINASMRVVDRSISGMALFEPWLTARSGNDTGTVGRLVVRQPRVDETSLGLKFSNISIYSVFVNNIQVAVEINTASQAFLFPSRILIPYANFPEIVDQPTAVLDTDSDSAVDVNPADGQEITAVTQFFGSSAFGAAQQSSVIVVFKEQSIYLVDANEKRAGRPPVQKIETEGVGCTAPNSVAVTKNGIIFANESGIYVLRRDLTVEYVGKFMERNWTERVNRDLLDIVQGHHFTVGRQYKLSVPLSGDDRTSEVFVYDHSNEAGDALGAWTRYDAHPSTGWCNLGRRAFFATSNGRVMQVRDDGDRYDYQDDNQPINMSIKLRPNDFGISGGRKVLDNVVIHYRNAIPAVGTRVLFATNTDSEYTESTGFIIQGQSSTNGMSDTVNKDIVSIQHNTNRRRGIYFSVEIINNTVLESAEIAGLEYKVGALTTGNGMRSARDTEK